MAKTKAPLPATQSTPVTQPLPAIRAQIADLQERKREVEQAPLPVEIIADSMRASLRRMAEPRAKIVARMAALIDSATEPVAPLLPSHCTPELMLGLLLDKIGDQLVDEAIAVALSKSADVLRLDPVEKAERLAQLHAALYDLELREEEIIVATGEPRRPNANPAAVLGIPADIAEKHRYFTGE